MTNRIVLLLVATTLLVAACNPAANTEIPIPAGESEIPLPDAPPREIVAETDHEENEIQPPSLEELITSLEEKYSNQTPEQWGENIPGVITKIDSSEKIIALTFDACGSEGDGYDNEIIDFLIEQSIPATLFISGRWIDRHSEIMKDLAQNPLFEIANHGYSHKPLSVDGKSAYGISGTASVDEVVREILLNEEKLLEFTGYKPKYFRSGTAYYDEIAVKIANDLDYQVINFSVLGDAGATYSKEQIIRACRSAGPGSIIIFHMNRPERGIAAGIIEGISQLQKRGYRFVKLSDYHEFLK